MSKQTQRIINASLLITISSMFVAGFIFDSIIFIVYYTVFIATVILLKLLNKKEQTFDDTLTIFLSTIFFGFILAFMVNSDFVQNGKTFFYPDQMHFYEEANKLSLSNSVVDLIEKAFFLDYRAYQMVYFMFGILSYLDRIVSGSVNFLPLLYSVVYVTAFIPVFFYHTIKLYLPRLISLKSSLFYALLTPIIAYSGYLLRDMHITLLTMIALFIMVRKVTITRVIAMVLLIPIAYHIRESNSLLLLAMLGIFVFTGKSSKKIKAISIVIGVAFLLYFSSELLNTLTLTENKLEGYSSFTSDKVQESAGIGGKLYGLPPIIKEFSIILFSLSAFPFFSSLSETISYQTFIMGVYSSITNIGWFFVFIGFIYFIKPIYKRILKMPNKIFLYLLVLFVLFMVANTTNMTFRRIISVLPFIYIPFMLVYNDTSRKERNRYKSLVIFMGLSLYSIYLFLII